MSSRRPITPHAGGRNAGTGGAGSGSGSRPAARRSGPRGTGSATSSAGRAAPGGARATVGVQEPAIPLPRLFTVRALVLFVVGMLAFVLLFPTVRGYLAQRADNARLVQQVALAREQNEGLESELERWNDPAYVAAQARERLAFVLPGETAFRVVDPEIVPDPGAPAAAAAGSGPALVPEGTTTPWYTTIWESVRVAGEADVAATDPAAIEPPAIDPAVPVPVPAAPVTP